MKVEICLTPTCVLLHSRHLQFQPSFAPVHIPYSLMQVPTLTSPEYKRGSTNEPCMIGSCVTTSYRLLRLHICACQSCLQVLCSLFTEMLPFIAKRGFLLHIYLLNIYIYTSNMLKGRKGCAICLLHGVRNHPFFKV